MGGNQRKLATHVSHRTSHAVVLHIDLEVLFGEFAGARSGRHFGHHLASRFRHSLSDTTRSVSRISDDRFYLVPHGLFGTLHHLHHVLAVMGVAVKMPTSVINPVSASAATLALCPSKRC